LAADIILYNAEFVPVGKDQIQHLEMTRDIASAFNNRYGETFILPQAKTDENVMVIPGTDGQKMSKSYNNYIDIFLPEKELRKSVMSIVTDSTPLEAPKNPDTDNTFAIYSRVAGPEQVDELRNKYLAGNFGYGHAKQELFELLLKKYEEERKLFHYYMNNLPELEKKLRDGAEKARAIAAPLLDQVKRKVGLI
jgi:tryptophanyl-tRNA synthetase